jgi:hypothetical protein
MMLWLVVVWLPAAAAHVTGRRELQSCGSATFVALAPQSSDCPSSDLQNCYDSVACGDLCEGDGECGTDSWLENCGNYDVYRRDCSSSDSTCSNTCIYSRDGDCDDGQAGSDYSYCECGTDCYDCGYRSCETPTPRPTLSRDTIPGSQATIPGTMVSGLSAEAGYCLDSVTFHYADGSTTMFGQSGGGSVPRVDLDPTAEYVSGLVQYEGCPDYIGGGIKFILKSIATGATTRTVSFAGYLQSSSVRAEFNVDWPCRIIGFETSPGDTHVSTSETVTSVQTDCATTQTPGSCAVCRASMMYDESDGVSCGGFTQQVKSKWGDWQWGHWEDYDGCHSTVCCADIKEDCCEANVGAIIGLIVAIFVVLAMCCYRSLIKDSILRVWRRCCPKHKVHPAIAATQNSRDTLPPYWNPIMNRLNAEKFPVDPGSEEYARVETAFMLTLFDPTRGLHRNQFTIQSVERIQNMDLWNLYVAKRKSVCGRKSPKDAQNLVRNWLFHGCSGDVTDEISQGGFNRSFVGRHATAYGKGIYFARDASYSTYPMYSERDANGVQSIFLARVVVGEYCLGVQDALVPAMRDATTHAHYDSTVDNLQNPNIFVTYNDAQAYPEYLIKFKQDGTPPSHPTIGKPAPPDYRPNVFSSCYD